MLQQDAKALIKQLEKNIKISDQAMKLAKKIESFDLKGKSTRSLENQFNKLIEGIV